MQADRDFGMTKQKLGGHNGSCSCCTGEFVSYDQEPHSGPKHHPIQLKLLDGVVFFSLPLSLPLLLALTLALTLALLQVVLADWGISVPVEESSRPTEGPGRGEEHQIGTEFWCAPEVEQVGTLGSNAPKIVDKSLDVH